MKVLVVGSGGREHALAWRISQDAGAVVFLAPGNEGARLEPCVRKEDIAANDFDGLIQFAKKEKIGLVVIGPDQLLADGIVDRFEAAGIPVFGPTQAAARLESSKGFAKDVMAKVGIPTARYQIFSEPAPAKKYLRECGWKTGWALKADGLALGKGVVVTSDLGEADSTIDAFMGGQHGASGKTIVIEERLSGREASAFYLCDGESALELAFACDHKQLLDGNLGPNTGGMGSFSPADWLPKGTRETVRAKIVDPLLKEMSASGVPYRGVLYVGLMLTESGPQVIEFNARFGDPETQAILPLLEGDFTGALYSVAKRKLAEFPAGRLKTAALASVHVVLAAHGYPESPRKGDGIRIAAELMPDAEPANPRVKLFFAGVKAGGGESGLVTNGGRVLGLTALAPTRKEARALAYAEIEKISFAGMQKRGDVGSEVGAQ